MQAVHEPQPGVVQPPGEPRLLRRPKPSGSATPRELLAPGGSNGRRHVRARRRAARCPRRPRNRRFARFLVEPACRTGSCFAVRPGPCAQIRRARQRGGIAGALLVEQVAIERALGRVGRYRADRSPRRTGRGSPDSRARRAAASSPPRRAAGSRRDRSRRPSAGACDGSRRAKWPSAQCMASCASTNWVCASVRPASRPG